MMTLADVYFQIEWLHNENEKRCTPFCTEMNGSGLYETISWKDITWEPAREEVSADPLCEFQNILFLVSDRLLKYDRCIVHGTAFLWMGKGYLFMAPSGTGKSTQYKHWRRKYRDEVHILNGDKPVLQRKENGSFYIHPTPWNGKEGWGRMETERLGGIIYLEQGHENHVERAVPEEMAVRVFRELLYSAADTKQVRTALEFTRSLIQSVPIWRLINRGDEDAAILTHDTLLSYLQKDQGKDEISDKPKHRLL